ncbi:MAG: hypothetical protein HC819_13820 [Cyclobacteriaceae bacterium]|nr:hypothetical protein [Cyclobacteriaceae bacterium]
MMKINILMLMLLGTIMCYGQEGIRIGDSSSPMYHYNGNVGIGITIPVYRLQVHGEFKAINNIFLGGVATSGMGIKADDSFGATIFSITRNLDNEIRFQGYGDLTFFTNGNTGSEKLRIRKDGRVGIGTIVPETNLHIEQSLNGELSMLIKNTYGAGARTFVTSIPGKSLIQTDRDFAISTNGGGWTDKFTLKNNGNVGIGTNTPDYKLDVLGTIRANEVKVATGWSDFVFEPDYHLPTLQEVENFIDLNGHLPDIPSAKEVEENGISLGEMDAKLLQKIEELTLYVIELKKENDQLKEVLKIQGLKTE